MSLTSSDIEFVSPFLASIFRISKPISLKTRGSAGRNIISFAALAIESGNSSLMSRYFPALQYVTATLFICAAKNSAITIILFPDEMSIETRQDFINKEELLRFVKEVKLINRIGIIGSVSNKEKKELCVNLIDLYKLNMKKLNYTDKGKLTKVKSLTNAIKEKEEKVPESEITILNKILKVGDYESLKKQNYLSLKVDKPETYKVVENIR